MTKRHFIAIAEVLHNCTNNDTRDEIAEELAKLFKTFNPRFREGEFLEAATYGR